MLSSTLLRSVGWRVPGVRCSAIANTTNFSNSRKDEFMENDEDPDVWLGFDGDFDKTDEHGVPTWLRAVRYANDRNMEEIEEGKDVKRRIMLERSIKRVSKIDPFGRSYGTGRRKTSAARVWISKNEGQSKITVNNKPLAAYFFRDSHREEVLAPFMELGNLGEFNVTCTVKGGGHTGQAGAIRHGISRALQEFDPEFRPTLKKAGFLTRDPRMVERKKPGQPKARKKFQWVKR